MGLVGGVRPRRALGRREWWRDGREEVLGGFDGSQSAVEVLLLNGAEIK